MCAKSGEILTSLSYFGFFFLCLFPVTTDSEGEDGDLSEVKHVSDNQKLAVYSAYSFVGSATAEDTCGIVFIGYSEGIVH